MKWESYRRREDGKTHGKSFQGIAQKMTAGLSSMAGRTMLQILKNKAVILKWAGKDATETHEPIHAADTVDKYFDPSKAHGRSRHEHFATSVDRGRPG